MPQLSGFTFIRNGFSLGYPFEESLDCLRSLCDEVVIAVGDSVDGTREYVESLHDTKLTILDTIWDDSKRVGGEILAEQTNIALQACKGQWCLYLQGDEVLHEDDYDLIRKTINEIDSNENIEGLIFRWHHFFGSYDYVGVGRQWYRREVRVIRNKGNVISYRDAQGFRVRNSDGTIRKIKSLQTEARVFHYGWVRHPRIQIAKQHAFQRLYHDDGWMQTNIPSAEEFQYRCNEIAKYNGTHPKLMTERIKRDSLWTQHFDPNNATYPKGVLVAITDYIEKYTGVRIGEFKNFVEVRR
jgi:glycosyltransferase involved in cell wall biosynthesis